MSTSLVWLIPIAITIGLLVVLAKLRDSSNRLARQSVRLGKQLAEFKTKEHEISKTEVRIKPATPDEAILNRRVYLTERTKNKSERQRRLVKRLRNLQSKESE